MYTHILLYLCSPLYFRYCSQTLTVFLGMVSAALHFNIYSNLPLELTTVSVWSNLGLCSLVHYIIGTVAGDWPFQTLNKHNVCTIFNTEEINNIFRTPQQKIVNKITSIYKISCTGCSRMYVG